MDQTLLFMQTQDQHSSHDPDELASHCDTDTIGKFLLVAERGLFLGCNGWDARFSYPLGEPTGPWQERDHGVLFRSFVSALMPRRTYFWGTDLFLLRKSRRSPKLIAVGF